MNDERVYLEITESSEKKDMWYIVCYKEANSGLIGYLSNSGKICGRLDRKLTGSSDLGTYFYSEDEAFGCISEFYIIQEKSG
jgi:hypothetical protein